MRNTDKNPTVLWHYHEVSLFFVISYIQIFHFFLSCIPLLLSVWTIWPFCEFSIFCWFFCSFVMCFFCFVFICARGVSENWRYCSVTSSDSVTPRRFFTTPTTRCCLGCGPTAPPTCRGTGTHSATSHNLTVHPDIWLKISLHTQTTNQNSNSRDL